MRTLGVLWIFFLLAGTAACLGQESRSSSPLYGHPPAAFDGYCNQSQGNGSALRVLFETCLTSALTIKQLPNVVCNETISRYETLSSGNHSPTLELVDVVTARVQRLEDGREYYAKLAVNGSPIKESGGGVRGMWSLGEFSYALQAVFDPSNAATFAFNKEEHFHSKRSLVFDFEVASRNNSTWTILFAKKAFHPGYRGSIRVDKKSGHVLQIHMRAYDFSQDFPYDTVEVTTKYADILLADGSVWMLPTKSEVVACGQRSRCLRNIVEFRNYQRLTAKAVIVPQEDE